MTNWENLVMWDNISFYYTTNDIISGEKLKQIKKELNKYINNIAYGGYIKKHGINMSPEISYNNGIIDYNVSAYPTPLPKNFPQDIFNVIPEIIEFENLTLTKKTWHTV